MAYVDPTQAAFDNARRTLDPVYEQQQSSFDQSMINRGWSPGSKGYTTAQDSLNRDRNDQYNTAAFGAMQYGDSRRDADRAFNETQRQFNEGTRRYDQNFSEDRNRYNKGFGEDKRRFDLGFGEDTRRYDQGFGEDARRYNQGFGEDTRRYDQGFGEDTRRFDLGFGEGQREFDLAFGEDQFRNRRDFGEDTRRYNEGFDLNRALQLDNVSRAYNDQAYRDAVFNASREDQQMAQLMSMMGFGPAGGAQPLDMGSAFNNSLAGEMYESNSQNDRINNYTTALGSLANGGAGSWLNSLFNSGSANG